MSEHKHHHHHREKFNFKHFIKHNYKWLLIILILLIFLIGFIIDNKKKEVELDNKEIIVETTQNYEAIITVVDGEGESAFTDAWGELIQDGYPICSDLVTDYVGTEDHMDWDTIEALNNIGVEFVFHSSNHHSYNELTEEEIRYDIERGVKVMEEHGLNHNAITWISGTREDICEIGYDYFKMGINDSPSVNTRSGDKSNPMMMEDLYVNSSTGRYTYEELIEYINEAITNNGWLIIFTRNPSMDEEHVNIYRQAFEYAKQHNVAVVTASEGYDLYYGNKLGNH